MSRPSFLHTSLLIFLGLTLTTALIVARSGFSVFSYPFLFPDSFDWLANGLRYSGLAASEFEISHRAMLLPLSFALLLRAGAEDLIVYFGLCFHLLTAASLFLLLRRLLPQAYAALAAMLFLWAYTPLAQSAYVGSDSAGLFFSTITILSLSLYRQTMRTRWLLVASISAAVGIHTQYIGVILMPTVLAALLLGSEKSGVVDLRSFLRTLLTRPAHYAIAALAFSMTLLLFLPRILEFHTLYTERVQHGSLVAWHIDSPLYYVAGLLSCFSWPVMVLCTAGTLIGLRTPTLRFMTTLSLLWIVNILVFFSFLYTWKDLRFLLYVSVPVLILSAVGALAIVNAPFCKLRCPRLLSFTINTAGAVALFFYVHSPSTNDPFDQTVAIVPWASVSLSQGTLRAAPTPRPYLLAHFSEARAAKESQARPGYDSLLFSPSHLHAFEYLRLQHHSLWRNAQLNIWTPAISANEVYIVRNRDTLYAHSPVEVLVGVTAFIDAFSRPHQVVVLSSHDLALLERTVRGLERGERLPLPASDMVALYSPSPLALTSVTSSNRPDFIASVSGIENSDPLFDGVKDDPRLFSAIPLHTPLTLTFTQPTQLIGCTLYLWHFDGRSYRFSIQTRKGSTWDSEKELSASGTATMEFRDGPFDALRVIGIQNSDTDQNPANQFFHLLEVECEARQ